MEKLAVISDIHGNIPALETILSDIRARGIDRIVCLGDVVGKGPQPAEAVDRCREVCEAVLMGNHDDIMSDGRDHTVLPFLRWHRERLGPERLDWLHALPPVYDLVVSGRKVRLYHASHISPYHRVLIDVPTEEHLAMFGNTDFTGHGTAPDVVGYGDIHTVYQKTFRDGRVLFNTGSVGNPLDGTLAAYAIIAGNIGDDRPGPFSLEFVRLPHDIDLEVRLAVACGLPEDELRPWEDELRTGRYRRDPASRAWRESPAGR